MRRCCCCSGGARANDDIAMVAVPCELERGVVCDVRHVTVRDAQSMIGLTRANQFIPNIIMWFGESIMLNETREQMVPVAVLIRTSRSDVSNSTAPLDNGRPSTTETVVRRALRRNGTWLRAANCASMKQAVAPQSTRDVPEMRMDAHDSDVCKAIHGVDMAGKL